MSDRREPRPKRGDLDAVFAAIETSERGPLGWLRSRRSRSRLAAALIAAALVPVAVFLAVPRRDLPLYAAGRMALALILMAATLAALAARALRRLDHLDRTPWADAALLAGAGLVTWSVALLPQAHAAAPPGDLVRAAAKCLAFGALTGAPVAAALLALDRVGSRRTLAEAILAGAVAGNLALQLHCPIVDVPHLVVGHALLVPLAAAAFALGWRLSRRLRAP